MKQTITLAKIDEAIKSASQNNLPSSFLAKEVFFDHKHNYMIVHLRNDFKLLIELKDFSSLNNASVKQRERYSLLGGGAAIHWKDLDEDLSVRGLLIDYAKISSRLVTATVDLFASAH